MSQKQDIPVYLFTGFLESGKTKFIQGTLEDKRFYNGERTLLLVCEDGEEEYTPDQFVGNTTYVRYVEDEEDLSEGYFNRLYEELHFDRVLVEYNGVWMLDSLYQALPEEYVVCQEFLFVDTTTFLNYNANMRQLVFDKIKSCELVVFNRFPSGGDAMPYHKIVRAINRRCTIAYEDSDGNAQYDEIEDPLPFDKAAPSFTVEDQDYALWYRDLVESTDSYNGHTVTFKAQVQRSKELPNDTAVVGRPLMNCCAADTSFAGLVAVGIKQSGITNGCWVNLTATIKIQKHPCYEEPGPVLHVKKIDLTDALTDPVATFY